MDEQLDDLLSRWHWWLYMHQQAHAISNGGHATSGYRSPPTYVDAMDAGEELDRRAEDGIMHQVDHEVRQLGDPWRSAIYALARSLCTGAAIFHSPRVKPEDRARITQEARAKLAARLTSAGLLTA